MSELFKRIRKEGGFTLVELMVVVAIISILVGVAVASFFFSTTRAKEATCQADLRIINEMIVKYDYDNNHKPATLEDLVPEYILEESMLYCPESGEHFLYDSTTGVATCPTCPP